MRPTALVKAPPKRIVVQGVPLPAPVGGVDGISPLANMPVDRAYQLDNWVPRPGWIEPRRGSIIQCTGVGLSNTPVQTMMAYNSFNPNGNKIFGTAGGTIYDCTIPGTAIATNVTGLATSRQQYIMFSNAADKQYLYTVNGFDAPWAYDGTSWTQPPITVAAGSNPFSPNDFVTINAYQGRLWFAVQNSTDPVYMTTVGGIQGTAYSFPLGQLLTYGGYLMAIGRWTVDTRQNVDEYIAFISSRGEVVVYAGTDPSTATTWALVGIYKIGAPIGRRCFLRISGDLQIITVDGIVGMSEMLSTDRAAANRVSLTSIIMNPIAQAAQLYKNNFGWELQEYPLGTLAILNIPMFENSVQYQYVMNTITGAWSRFIGLDPTTYLQNPVYGMNANTWVVDATDNIYWGGNNGTVYKWNVGSGDADLPIVCVVKGAYNSFGNAAQLKRYTMLQPLITLDANVNPSIGINVDFNDAPSLSTEQQNQVGPLWDQVNWDQFEWGPAATISNNWISVDGMGHYVSIVTTITTYPNPNNPTQTIICQLNGWNILAESGAFV